MHSCGFRQDTNGLKSNALVEHLGCVMKQSFSRFVMLSSAVAASGTFTVNADAATLTGALTTVDLNRAQLAMFDDDVFHEDTHAGSLAAIVSAVPTHFAFTSQEVGVVSGSALAVDETELQRAEAGAAKAQQQAAALLAQVDDTEVPEAPAQRFDPMSQASRESMVAEPLEELKKFAPSAATQVTLTDMSLASGVTDIRSGVISNLSEAIEAALLKNPIVEAERSTRAIAGESLQQARAGRKPSVNLTSNAGFSRTDSDLGFNPTNDQNVTSGSIGLEARQSIWSSGAVTARIRQAKAGVKFADGQLTGVFQDLILQVVTAYMDVNAAESEIEIREHNVALLRTQVEAANDRFRVGEVTRTDVAQADARLAGALAQLAQSRALLEAARASFVELTGALPAKLEDAPVLKLVAPSVEEAMRIAQERNPNVETAKAALEAARQAVKVAKGEYGPNLDLVGSAGLSRTQADDDFNQEDAQILAQFSMPLYQGGFLSSRVRAAKLEERRARDELRSAQNSVLTQVARAWHGLVASQEGIRASERQVQAAQIAYEGAEQELAVGLRTTLDVLDSERVLLEARLSLVQAERNAYIAQQQLAAATGLLAPEDFGVQIPIYNATAYSGSGSLGFWPF